MSLKAAVSARLSAFLLSERRLEQRRARAESARLRRGEPHRIEFFHQADDPYSHLLAQALLELDQRYEVEVVTWLVAPPEDWAAPERQRLDAYSLLDAKRLARKAGMRFAGRHLPSDESVARVHSELLTALDSLDAPGPRPLLEKVVAVGDQLWHDDLANSVPRPSHGNPPSRREIALRAGTARRQRLGHYLGGTCFYGGEWFWGIDRLEYLEERLAALGARRHEVSTIAPAAAGSDSAADTKHQPIYGQPPLLEQPIPPAALAIAQLPDLHFFASFRSPYTYIVTERVCRLAAACGVQLRLRFVLPMVMRGLPVKRAKRLYILRDAAREARRHGVPFGPIADPVGKAVERGYSLLPWAIDQGRGAEYGLSFMTHVWSQAVDAASTKGLRRIVEHAGLDWAEARTHLDDPAWRATAEHNRQELLDLGLWGVPSYRVGELAIWGQDRLWVLEDEYRRLLAERSPARRPGTGRPTTEFTP